MNATCQNTECPRLDIVCVIPAGLLRTADEPVICGGCGEPCDVEAEDGDTYAERL